MTQPNLGVEELLTAYGELWRASMPQLTREEEEARCQRTLDRLTATMNAKLDADGVVICCLCHRPRPRRLFCEPRYYPAGQCLNVRKPWHYHRIWGNPKANRREERRHRRRIRKGALPRVPIGGLS